MKVDFRAIPSSGDPEGMPVNYKTPPANRLKTLRGHLLRTIVRDDIRSFDGLRNLESHEFAADAGLSTADRLVMLTD